MSLSPLFETYTLDQILRDRAFENEKERQELLQKVIQWLDKYGLKYGIYTAYIFGSLTQSQKFHQYSDIDIAVEEINPDDFFVVMSLISEAMQRDVDLIQIHKCHFSDRIKSGGIRWTLTN